jgi:ATP-binding protein involved in chromosome partitioning
MFMMNAIDVPVLGVVENMAYFTPAELPENKYYIFGQGGGQHLAQEFGLAFLGEIPLVKSISDAGDAGKPVILETENPMSTAFVQLAQKVAQQVAIQNAENQAVKI